MGAIGELLFFTGFGARASLDAVLREKTARYLPDAVNQLTKRDFEEKSGQQLLAAVAAQIRMSPIELDEKGAEPKVVDVPLSGTDEFGQPFSAVSLKITKEFPYTGDTLLWHLAPCAADTDPPRGEIRGRHLVIGIELPSPQAECAITWIEENIAKVRSNLARQDKELARFDASLEALIPALLEKRRAHLAENDDIIRRLGGEPQ